MGSGALDWVAIASILYGLVLHQRQFPLLDLFHPNRFHSLILLKDLLLQLRTSYGPTDTIKDIPWSQPQTEPHATHCDHVLRWWFITFIMLSKSKL